MHIRAIEGRIEGLIIRSRHISILKTDSFAKEKHSQKQESQYQVPIFLHANSKWCDLINNCDNDEILFQICISGFL